MVLQIMLPKVNHRIVVQTLTSDFRAATKFIEEPIAPLGKRDMLIKNVACGINASDVNFASGSYLPGVKPPFPCGFEAVGTVVAAGQNAQLKEGDHCVYTEYGAFAEYTTIKKAFPLPQPDPQARDSKPSLYSKSLILHIFDLLSSLFAKSAHP